MTRLNRIVMVFAIAFTASSVTAEEFSVMYGAWPPFANPEGSDRPGLVVDIMDEALSRSGHSFELVAVPWTRSLRALERGTHDALILVAPGEAEAAFHPTPFVSAEFVFITRAGYDFDFTGRASLRDHHVSYTQDYFYYNETVDTYLAENSDSNQVEALAESSGVVEQHIRRLLADRTDVVLGAQAVFSIEAQALDLADQLHFSEPVGAAPLHMAFSLALDDAQRYARQVENNLQEMISDGTLDEIFAVYGLER